MFRCHLDLGSLRLKENHPSEAVSCFHEALAVLKKKPNPQQMADTLREMAKVRGMMIVCVCTCSSMDVCTYMYVCMCVFTFGAVIDESPGLFVVVRFRGSQGLSEEGMQVCTECAGRRGDRGILAACRSVFMCVVDVVCVFGCCVGVCGCCVCVWMLCGCVDVVCVCVDVVCVCIHIWDSVTLLGSFSSFQFFKIFPIKWSLSNGPYASEIGLSIIKL